MNWNGTYEIFFCNIAYKSNQLQYVIEKLSVMIMHFEICKLWYRYSVCKDFWLQWGIKKFSIAIEYVNSNSELRFMNHDTSCRICNNA